MHVEPQKEHQWLQRLVGEWTYEGEAQAGPDKPAEKFKGTETVRSIGGIWIVAEGRGEMGGDTATMIITLGYDTQARRYVGTWIGSMMTRLWVYEGALDAAERVLTLESEGPHMAVEGKMTKYRDVTELASNDHRVFTSHMLGDDGKWQQFMTIHYRRAR